MLYDFIRTSIDNLQLTLQDNVMIYFVISLLYYLVGGADETLITLIILHVIYAITCLMCRIRLCANNFISVYLIIIIGNILDNILNLGNTSLRAYLILYYTYNTLVDTLNMMAKHNVVPIPKKLKNMISKLKKE